MAIITTMSSSEFNQNTDRAMQAASSGPVFITNGGSIAYVLLTIDDYQQRALSHVSIADQLAMPGIEDVPFDPPRLGRAPFSSAELEARRED